MISEPGLWSRQVQPLSWCSLPLVPSEPRPPTRWSHDSRFSACCFLTRCSAEPRCRRCNQSGRRRCLILRPATDLLFVMQFICIYLSTFCTFCVFCYAYSHANKRELCTLIIFIIFKQNIILYLYFLSCKYIFYTLKQTVVYITESTFYNYLQHSLGLTSEKQHQF